MFDKAFKVAMIIGLAILILLMVFRLACECGTDPWAYLDDNAQSGEVFDNDI